MADPTAELLVKIGADTKQLKTGLDAADKRVGGFANTIGFGVLLAYLLNPLGLITPIIMQVNIGG